MSLLEYQYYCMYRLMKVVPRDRPVEHYLALSLSMMMFSVNLLTVFIFVALAASLAGHPYLFTRVAFPLVFSIMLVAHLLVYFTVYHDKKYQRVLSFYEGSRATMERQDVLFGLGYILITIMAIVSSVLLLRLSFRYMLNT